MTVSSSTNSRIAYNGDGASTVFPWPYDILATTDLLVYVGGVLKTLTTDYAVAIASDFKSANVTFISAPIVSLSNIVFIRNPDLLQSSALPSTGPFPSTTVERGLDKLTLIAQRLKDLITRSVTLADSDTSGASTTLPTPIASQFLGWNVAGNALTNYPGVTGAPVSTAMIPVVVASTLSAALALLGGVATATYNAFVAATNAALALLAPLASPTFTGTPLTPTAAAGTNNTQIGSTAFTQNAINVYSNGFRSKFRNSQFQIAQRGISGTIVGLSTLNYTLDGWMVWNTGAVLTWAQGTSSSNYPGNYSLQINGAASNTGTQVRQRIESYMAGELAGQRVTIRFDVAQTTANNPITPLLSVSYANAKDNFGGGVTAIVNAVSLQTVANTGAWTTLAYTFDMPSNAQNGVEVLLDFNTACLATKSLFIDQADIRVTASVPTGLNSNPPITEIRNFATELQLNQRYYFSTFGNGVTPAQNTGVNSAFATCGSVTNQNFGASLMFAVPMRASPTVTTYSPNAASANWSTNGTTPTSSVQVTNSVGLGIIGTTAVTAGNLYSLHVTASSEL